MTFQNSEITKSSNFEIIIEDQKVYFSDYPDFPLFEKTIFPDEAWEQMEIDFKKLFDDLLCEPQLIEKLYGLLQEEDKATYTPKENASKIFDRFYEIIDPDFVIPEGEEEAIETEAYHLHCIIKYDICIPNPLYEFSELLEAIVLNAVYKQGYDVDPCVGEITKVSTAELSPENHP
tara:strand:+ start:293 stop:820 length:528 start_codon:yes stop_codon:yes gene_type:complete